MKNIDLLSAFNDLSTSDDVTSLITDEDNTLVDEPSAMEDSLIASEELQSALMLYNDSFPVGQETVIENGKTFFPFLCIKGDLILESFSLLLKSPKKVLLEIKIRIDCIQRIVKGPSCYTMIAFLLVKKPL